MNTNTTANIVSWVALIAAIIALILAWVAYNREGADVGTSVRQEVEEQTTDLEENFSQLEADLRNQLEELRADMGTDTNGTGTIDENVTE